MKQNQLEFVRELYLIKEDILVVLLAVKKNNKSPFVNKQRKIGHIKDKLKDKLKYSLVIIIMFSFLSEDLATTATEDISSNTITNLLDLLQTNLNLPTYHLTEDQQKWIQLFIKCSPESFTKIDSDIQMILSTESLGLQSIPKIIQLCADIFNKASSEHGIANASNIIDLIKFILNILLESSLISLSDIDKSIIQALVDSSLSLLSIILVNSQSQTVASSNVDSPPLVSNNKCCMK
jgi:hypothetical protein